MGLGEMRLETQALLIVADRRVELPLGTQSIGQIVMRRRELGTKLQRLLDIVDGQVVPADLVSDQTEEMQRIEMAGIALENLPVEQFGLVKTTCLVMLQSYIEQFGYGLHVLFHDRYV